jgi:hypothetical protein
MTSMGNLLSASSLLMAIAAIIFSLWYKDITDALALKTILKRYREDNIQSKKVLIEVLYTKALPITIISIIEALIFLPDTIKLIYESLTYYQYVTQYDAVGTAYCFVSLLSIILAFYTTTLVFRLIKLIRKVQSLPTIIS